MKQRPAGTWANYHNPRDVRPQEYDSGSSVHERLKYLINYAVLAPSTHNTQPWLFRVSDSTVDILADRSRALPVVDPEDRCLLISCGAASGTLSCALDAVGLDHHLTFLPNPTEPDLVARVEITAESTPRPDWKQTLNAIRSRKTIRTGFKNKRLGPTDLQFVSTQRNAEEVKIELVETSRCEVGILEAIWDAEAIRLKDKHYLRESALWSHPIRNRSRDGIPEQVNLVGSVKQLWSPTEGTQSGNGTISGVAVVLSPANKPLNWLQTGFEMALMLIEAAGRGLNAAIIIHPLLIPDIRLRIQDMLNTDWTAQVLLRIGVAEYAPLTPRRAVVDVMMHPGFSR